MGWGGGASSSSTHSPGPMNIASASAAVPPPLKTAFSSRTGKTLRISNGAVFGRILEEGVDVLVVLHDGEGRNGRGQGKGQGQGRSQRVVECVRDERVGIDVGEGGREGDGDGDGFGMWTVWR